MAQVPDGSSNDNWADEVLARKREEIPVRAAAIRQATTTNPDQWAESVLLSKRTGIPADAVQRNLPKVKQQVTAEDIDAMVNEAPNALKRSMENVDFARVTIDDVPTLTDVTVKVPALKKDYGFAQASKDLRKAQDAKFQTALDYTADKFNNTYVDADGNRFEKGDNASVNWRMGLNTIRNAYYGLRAANFADLARDPSNLEAKQLLDTELAKVNEVQQENQELAALRRDATQRLFNTSNSDTSVFEKMSEIGAAVMDDPIGIGTDLFVQSGPASLAILAAAALTRIGGMNPNVVSTAGGMTSTAVEAGNRYVANLQMGQNHDDAWNNAIVGGAVVGIFDAVSIASAGSAVGAIANAGTAARIGRVAKEVGAQAALGAGGEANAALVTNQAADPAEMFAEAFGEVAGAGFEGITSAPKGALRAIMKGTERAQTQIDEAQATGNQAAALANLFNAASQSLTRTRDADSFAQLIQDAAEDGDAPTHLYISGAVLAQTLQEAGVDVNAMPTVAAALPEALQLNKDVALPIGEVTAALAGSGLEQTLMPFMKFEQEGLTIAESQQVFEQQAQIMREEASQAIAEQQDVDAWEQSAQTVYDNISQQLNTANRFTADVNQAYASLVRDFYTATAGRMNMTPEEMYKEFPLQIRAESPISQDMFDQNGALVTDTPNFKNWFGSSKVVDASGAPRVMYHGTAADITEFKPKQANAIFVTDNADFAHGFAVMSESWMRERGIEGAQNIMPVYVSAQNPFDYQNPEHVAAVKAAAVRTGDPFYDAPIDALGPDGDWASIEYKSVQDAIKQLGFDSFYVSEAGVRNLAVYDATQIKSATGNNGNFDPNDANILKQTATVRSGKETLKKFGLKPGVKYMTRQIAAALEARQRAKYGLIAADDRSPEATKQIAKWMVEEVMFEMQHPEKSGVGWYSEKFQRAIDIFAEQFPELKTDQNARDILTALIAITSDGQKVVPNFMQAADIYSNFRDTGKFATDRGHQRQASIDINLGNLQKLFDKMGAEGMRDYLMQEKTVSELKKLAAAEGINFSSDYQAKIKLPLAAVIFGPKLGAFYANLMGAHGYLTMDRWWSRTFNRYRGTLLMSPTRDGLDRFKNLLGHPEWSDDETIAATVAPHDTYAARGFKGGSEIEKAANTIYKAAFDGLEDAPFNATDRTFMLEAVDLAQKSLKRKGQDISIADIQAILWYYEKRLYGELGARQSADVSYEEAAQRVIAAIRESAEPNVNGTPVGEEFFNDGEIPEARVIFEVAPDPNNPAVTARWNALRPETRTQISNDIAKSVVPNVLQMLNTSGTINEQVGGYLGATNPSLAVVVDDVAKAVDVAKALGVVLSQDSMVVSSEVEIPGTEATGAIHITLPENAGFEFVEALYQKLWEIEVNGEKLVGGHTTANGQMVLLNFSDLSNEDYANLVDRHLGGAYEIGHVDIFTAFPENGKDYDYGSAEIRQATGQQSAEGDPRSIRDQAAQLIERAIESASVLNQYGDRGRRDSSRATAPLEGAPSVPGFSGPDPRLVAVAEQYARDNGLPVRRQAEYVRVNPELAARLAAAYDEMPHAPQDPVVKAAFDNLIVQTTAQYRALEAAGYKFWFMDMGREDNQEYASSPWNAMRDIRANQTMGVFPTDEGFGSDGEFSPEANPLLLDTGITWPVGDLNGPQKRVLANDLFRAVHDAFGHGLEGAGFRAEGEENAWQAHSRLFTGSALAALTSETRGQNSWLNFGPYGDSNRTAKVEDTVFADQKTGLLPEWAWTEGVAPDMSDELNQNEKAPLGTFDPANLVLTLRQGADLSTFIHETGHFFLEVQAALAVRPNAPAQIVKDMQTTMDWFGIKDAATWRTMTLEQQRPFHEKFARGFEAYAFEGNAPSQGMQQVFQRFSAWMRQVYRSLQAFLKANDVTLSNDMRQVFDRMLASESQIMEAQQSRAFRPLFENAEQAGMSKEEWEAYQETNGEALDEATSNLQRRSLRDMRWAGNARDKIIKALQKDAADKRKAVRAEAATEVSNEPVYQAFTFLKKGEMTSPEGEAIKVTEGFKLSKGALAEMFPPGALGATDLSGLKGMTAEEGLHPDLVASMFGFTSGDHLVRAILDAQPVNDVIEAVTDQRMMERFGDLTNPDVIKRAADDAIHNEARTRFVATELSALGRSMGKTRELVKAAKQVAAESIARRKVRDLRPNEFISAAVRAGKAAEAALKKGDLPAATRAKRDQLLNTAASRAAMDATGEVEKALRYFARFDSDTIRQKVDPDYADQIDALLSRFDLRKGQSLKAIDRRKTLADWIQSTIENTGVEPAIDPRLIDEANRKSFKDMTIEEMRGLVDAIRQIEHIGRLKTKLLTAKDNREFAARIDEAVLSLQSNANRTVVERIERSGFMDRIKDGFGEYFAMHRKLSSLIREMDGGKDIGAMWSLLVRPMNEKGDQEASMRAEATRKLADVFQPMIKKGGLNKKTFIPEINNSLTKEARLMVALNWGNEANRQRVMDGDNWSIKQVDAILATLDAEDWQFVQNVWNMIDSYWPDIAAKERRVTGVEPGKVERSQVMTPFGQLAGGYFPIMYDPNRSSKAESHSDAEVAKQMMQGAYTRSTTARGHTKARVDEVVGRPVRKDFGVISQHVNQVIHDLSWHEWLIDANRILRNGKMDSAIREAYGPELLRMMKSTVKDIAAGEVGAQNVFERSINHLRVGATVSGLAWNLWTSLLQPLGLTQSAARIGPKWVLKGVGTLLSEPTKINAKVEWIRSKSVFMTERGRTMQREINEILNKVDNAKLTAIESTYFYAIQAAQTIADVPTWLGQYEKSMSENYDEATAIAAADQAVIDSQGGGQVKDLSGIQRGSPLLKLWTNFYSYFNVTYNIAAQKTRNTDFKNPSEIAALAVDYALLMVVPSVLSTIMKEAIKGGGDDDDLWKKIVSDQLGYTFGLMVGLREIGAVFGSSYGYTGPAGIRFLSELNKLGKQIEQGEADVALLKALNNSAGILLHYPAGQVQRTAQGVAATVNGDVEGLAIFPALLFGPRKD
jgi:hypothetical protein